jgi:sortase B
MNKKVKKLTTVLFSCLLIFSIYNIFNYKYVTRKSRINYENIKRQYYGAINQSVNDDDLQEEIEKSFNMGIFKNKMIEAERNDMKMMAKKVRTDSMLKLKEMNEDIAGWISISGTSIDYPVLKTDNNSYYLSRDIFKKNSATGALFVDFRNVLTDKERNTIIYGHNMKEGSMFHDLKKYREKSFFESNSKIVFDTCQYLQEWEVFSVYLTDTSFNYIQTNFDNNEEYLKFLNAIKSKSMFHSKVNLNETDRILTLSTCNYEINNGRFVVHAKLINIE